MRVVRIWFSVQLYSILARAGCGVAAFDVGSVGCMLFACLVCSPVCNVLDTGERSLFLCVRHRA